MSTDVLQGKLLYNDRMSEEWLYLLEDAPVFNRYDLKAISALLAAPCGIGTVILRDTQYSFDPDETFHTLRTFHQTHRFFDYSLTRRCFSMIDGLSSYKVPFVNWHYVLCPLEKPENSTWLNPLAVYELRTIDGVCYAELMSGLVLELPVQKRSFIGQAERALYALAYLRREYSLTLTYNGTPLDYLQLPYSPFLDHLKEQSLLQSWRTNRGAFQQQYLTEAILRRRREALGEAIDEEEN